MFRVEGHSGPGHWRDEFRSILPMGSSCPNQKLGISSTVRNDLKEEIIHNNSKTGRTSDCTSNFARIPLTLNPGP